MKGQPKYKYGDRVIFEVEFENGPKEIEGAIGIVDAYGTFFDPSDASYDIFDMDGYILFKHIREDSIIKKIGSFSEEEMDKLLSDR